MLSGVNRGRNAAEDVLYSGTVAAAKEARARHSVVRAVAGLHSGNKQQPALADRDGIMRPTSSGAC